MDKYEIRNHLEELSEQEQAGLIDNFKVIRSWVQEYQELYKCDPWLSAYRSQYLDIRRDHHNI